MLNNFENDLILLGFFDIIIKPALFMEVGLKSHRKGERNEKLRNYVYFVYTIDR